MNMETYGRTFQLWRVEDIPANIRFVSGRLQMEIDSGEKVRQDLCILIRTQLGEDMFHPNTGFDSLKVVQERASKAMLKYELEKCINTYPWLDTINSIEIGDINAFRQIPVSISITTVKGDEIQLNMVI